MKKYFFSTFVFIFAFFVSATSLNAATLSFVPEATSFGIGESFDVVLTIDADSEFINATQATVSFPNDVLELEEVVRTKSVFSFWVEEPVISNDDGTVRFIGGSAKGLSGESLHVFTMKFRTTGAGSASLTISNAVITASDGKGTNVLESVEEATITVGTQVIRQEVSTPVPSAALAPVVVPLVVTRQAIVAENLPDAPVVTVPLYPDSSKWYSVIGEAIVLWEVPDDVIEVAIALDQSPNTIPPISEESLFTGKSIGMLEEGVWYVHVQFKNNVGWGETTHYKVSIDTTAPLQFEAEIDNEVSDNPAPIVTYEANDSLSGVSETRFFVDGVEVARATESPFKIPPQAPGTHAMSIRVFDKAGNSVEDTLDFEVIPLPTPIVDFITQSVTQGEFVFASGKTLPDSFVDIRILDKSIREVIARFVSSEASGNWEVIVEEPLARGSYTLIATVRDDRGAVSFPTEPISFKVKAPVIISFGFIDLGLFEILIMVLLVVAAVGSAAMWFYVSERQTRGAYKDIALRDVTKLSTLLENDVAALEKWFQMVQTDPRSKEEINFLFKKIKETAQNMRKYIGQSIEKLR